MQVPVSYQWCSLLHLHSTTSLHVLLQLFRLWLDMLLPDKKLFDVIVILHHLAIWLVLVLAELNQGHAPVMN